MYGSIIRKLAMYGGAIALATALAAPPALADDDDDDDKDVKITSTSELDWLITVRGKNFSEFKTCVILDGQPVDHREGPFLVAL